MKQLPLPNMEPPDQIVNVASVPHRSLFRYPGGKTWLIPRIRQWMSGFNTPPEEFIEPFAGGAIVGLSVAFDKLARHVTLVELDEQIAAVWQTIIEDGHGKWLAAQIENFELSPQNIEALLSISQPTTRELALQTVVRNRINRGGILAPGAGRIKLGENGKGLASRWYPKTLFKRTMDIVTVQHCLTFIHGDGLETIRQTSRQENVVYFVDPPYTASGKKPGRRLYKHSTIDHAELFEVISGVAGDFLMTYDDDVEIREMAKRYNFTVAAVPMKNTHHTKQTELLIGRHLNWF